MHLTRSVVYLATLLALPAVALRAQQQADSGRVFTPDELSDKPTVLQEPPAILGGDSIRVLKRVVVRFVLDTSGHAEPSSLRIEETADSGLDLAAEQYVLAMAFRPARADHRPVRTVVDLAVWLPTERVDTTGSTGAGVDTSMQRVSAVVKRPKIIWGPPLRFPAHDFARSGYDSDVHVHGRVIVEAIVDTSGRAEPRSVRVVKSLNPRFDQAAKAWILEAHFRPAYIQDRPVRILIQIPVDFRSPF